MRYSQQSLKNLIFIFLTFFLQCQDRAESVFKDSYSSSSLPSPCIAGGVSHNIETLKKELDLSKEMGIKILRRDFLWDQIEPQIGVTSPTYVEIYRNFVKEAYGRGMSIIAIIAYSNPLASSAGKKCLEQGEKSSDLTAGCISYPPDNPEVFGDYSAKVAELFPEIQLFEIWNEPNLTFRFFRSDERKYYEMLKSAYLKINAKRRSMGSERKPLISFGGLAMAYLPTARGAFVRWDEFLENVLSVTKSERYFDAMSFHPYISPPPLGYPPSLPPEEEKKTLASLENMTKSLMDLLSFYGIKVPLWITEIGWPTVSVTEDNQRDWLVRSYLLSAVLGIDVVCFYTFSDSSFEASITQEKYFGVVRSEEEGFSKKKSFFGIKIMNSILDGKKYDGSIKFKMYPDVYSLSFSGKNEKVIVFWVTEEKGENEILFDVERDAKIVFLNGEELQVKRGVQRLKITPSPLFLVLSYQ